MKKIGVLFLTLLLLLGLGGCSRLQDLDLDFLFGREESQQEDVPKDLQEELEEAAEVALDVLIGAESAEHGVILGAEGLPVVPQNTGIAALLMTYVEYDVLEVTADEDAAMVRVEITAPDSAALIKQALDNIGDFEQEAFQKEMEELLEDDPAMVSFTVDLQMEQVDGVWCVVMDFELSNALTGGLTQAYAELQKQVMEQLMKGGDEG